MQAPPSTLSLRKMIMSEKTCLLLSILFISVLFFPLTTAGRVLLADTPAREENYESTDSGNGRSKIGVRGSKSDPAHSATGQSSPSQASPTRTSSRATIPSSDGSPCSHIPGTRSPPCVN